MLRLALVGGVRVQVLTIIAAGLNSEDLQVAILDSDLRAALIDHALEELGREAESHRGCDIYQFEPPYVTSLEQLLRRK